MDCPLLEKMVSCCDEFLNVSHLDYALRVCAEQYLTCPVYRRHEQERTAKPASNFSKNQVA